MFDCLEACYSQHGYCSKQRKERTEIKKEKNKKRREGSKRRSLGLYCSDTNCCDMVTANEVQRKMGEEGEGTEGDREGGELGKDANYID